MLCTVYMVGLIKLYIVNPHRLYTINELVKPYFENTLFILDFFLNFCFNCKNLAMRNKLYSDANQNIVRMRRKVIPKDNYFYRNCQTDCNLRYISNSKFSSNCCLQNNSFGNDMLFIYMLTVLCLIGLVPKKII